MLRRNRFLGCVLVALLCAGCAHPLKTRKAVDFDPVKPMRVAVLPFAVKKDSQKKGAEKVRRAFAAKLQESNLEVADIPYVDRMLAAHGWTTPGELQTIPAEELGECLGVDALIYGEVTKWDKLYAVVHAHSAMAAKADMVDAHTGKWLWSSEKDGIRMKGILKGPVIIYMTPVPPLKFALEGFQMGEMTDEMTREMAKPLVNAAKEGPNYAALMKQRPRPLSTERALALQKSVLEPERHYAKRGAPAVVAASTPAPSSKGRFAVQFCATHRRAGAYELTSQLQAKGYSAYMVTADIPGQGRFHRVRVRGFETRQQAAVFGSRVGLKEGLPFWVDRTDTALQLACW